MAENSNSDPVRPPPLSGARRPGPFAPLRAFLVIRQIHFSAWLHRRPVLAVASAAVLVLAAGAGTWVAVFGMPDLPFGQPKTLSQAREAARAKPSDASVQRDLGHKLWDARKHRPALAAYGRALALDRSAADDRMIANLVAAFGTAEQREAESLISKYDLTAADKPLQPLVHSKRYGVRWAAVHTLDRLRKGSKANWETAYILDLDSSECNVRRQAVDKLGIIGTKRAVAALHAAKAEDAKTGGWFRPRCLGDRLDTAEQKILARR
ncbi:MAG TPA: hypothetical protein VLU43_04760 [Anaeromyxobacteraceae bacterium]|nr:hypothetical protein [Anaeromyxobacteraceae bacterium]